jgi:hypothetical protein
VGGTGGRAIYQMGFELNNLDEFTPKRLAGGIMLNVSYGQVPKTDMYIAFITDPWGTSIELSEGLANIP